MLLDCCYLNKEAIEIIYQLIMTKSWLELMFMHWFCYEGTFTGNKPVLRVNSWLTKSDYSIKREDLSSVYPFFYMCYVNYYFMVKYGKWLVI